MLIPGEPLLCPPERRIVLPGTSTRDLVRDTATRLVAWSVLAWAALYLIYWLAVTPSMSDDDRVILTRQAILDIQEAWDNRVTIQSLAREYSVEERMIRYIISLPRRQRPT